MKKTINIIFYLLLIAFCAIILAISLRGLPGNPTSHELSTSSWKENGPFELSPERGRFTLLYSIVEDKSFYFSKELALFSAPDIGFHNGHYVSLFAPLVSFIAIPGYLIGKYFGASQVGAYAIIALCALLNMMLIRSISTKLGANPLAATVGALIYLFATPSFAYAVTLYQHQVSTLLILVSVWLLLTSKKWWSLSSVFMLCALAIPLDYPNLFFMFPIGLYALQRIISFEHSKKAFTIQMNMLNFFAPLAMIVPILFFLWFNQVSYGDPLQLSGTVQTAEFTTKETLVDQHDLEAVIDSEQKDPAAGEKSAVAFFDTRDMLNGFYIHLLSPDRGILFYAPVLIFGIIGLILGIRRKTPFMPLFGAIIGANLILYSMWGDPWGGWAFGSRYLIPTYALLAICIGLFLTYWRNKSVIVLLFVLITYYSVGVNTLGALTTSAMPPKIQVLELEKISGTVQKYTYMRNWDMIMAGHSKSFAYQTYFHKFVTADQFFIAVSTLITLVVWLITLYYLTLSISEPQNDTI